MLAMETFSLIVFRTLFHSANLSLDVELCVGVVENRGTPSLAGSSVKVCLLCRKHLIRHVPTRALLPEKQASLKASSVASRAKRSLYRLLRAITSQKNQLRSKIYT